MRNVAIIALGKFCFLKTSPDDGSVVLVMAKATVEERLTALEDFREEVRLEFQATRAEMRQLNEETRNELRTEMRALNEATLSQMRLLHEDVVERFKTLGEAVDARPRRRTRRQ